MRSGAEYFSTTSYTSHSKPGAPGALRPCLPRATLGNAAGPCPACDPRSRLAALEPLRPPEAALRPTPSLCQKRFAEFGTNQTAHTFRWSSESAFLWSSAQEFRGAAARGRLAAAARRRTSPEPTGRSARSAGRSALP